MLKQVDRVLSKLEKAFEIKIGINSVIVAGEKSKGGVAMDFYQPMLSIRLCCGNAD